MIWIIENMPRELTNADELLESFLDIHDENAQVQLQLLALVKLFLKETD